ncbi:complement C1q-like protein 4 [Biomphalaria pfeifferi]|uniref:Complement C1q-like protein 4 n=1 Tax=Biomphalaria pfeifferi TaxID=112525 RepID=A0AAD8C7A1_BIOPF|nr:complement C1q-like protein 4 [Biomphalaria pfeifferi]
MWTVGLFCLLFCSLSAITAQEECVDESAVIASVGITNIRVVQQGQILKYQKINANLGNGYNSNTGIFTAPRAGVYTVYLNGRSQKDKELYMALYLNNNNQRIMTIFTSANNKHGRTNNSATLKLNKGDRLYVKAERDSYLWAEADNTFNSMTIQRVAFS